MFASMVAGSEDAFDLDVEWRAIAPEAKRVWFAAVAIPLAVAGLALVVVAAVLLAPVAAVAAAALAAGALLLVWRFVDRRYRSWGYALREDDLVLRRGVIMRRLTIVPYGRMQFVDVGQGPLDRAWNVANVQLHTAAAASDAKIPLLGLDEANSLRDQLTALGEAASSGL
jgi:uncharacterized protein